MDYSSNMNYNKIYKKEKKNEKLLPVITSLLIFAGLFTACGNKANTPELTEEEEYEIFYNKIAAHDWIEDCDYDYTSFEYNKFYLRNNVAGEDISLYGKKKSDNQIERLGFIFTKDKNYETKISSNKWQGRNCSIEFINDNKIKLIENTTQYIGEIILIPDNKM